MTDNSKESDIRNEFEDMLDYSDQEAQGASFILDEKDDASTTLTSRLDNPREPTVPAGNANNTKPQDLLERYAAEQGRSTESVLRETMTLLSDYHIRNPRQAVHGESNADEGTADARVDGELHSTSRITTTNDLAAHVNPPPANEEDQLLDQYKTYIISIMPLNAQQKINLRDLLDQEGWPQTWVSLVLIEQNKEARWWDWFPMENKVLRALKERFDMSWEDMAEYLYIGMRPSQCRLRYEEITAGNDGSEG